MYQVQFKHSYSNGNLVLRSDRIMEVGSTVLVSLLIDRLYQLYHYGMYTQEVYSQKLYYLIESMMLLSDVPFTYDSDWVRVTWREV